MSSPTQRSLKHLRDAGYKAWVTEYFNHHTRRRVDLFGAWDIAAVGNGEFLLVQTTSGSNVGARVKKIADNEYTGPLRDAGVRLEVHGWRQVKVKCKNGNTVLRWKPRIIDVS